MKTRVNPTTGRLERYQPSTPGFYKESRGYGSASHSRLTAGWGLDNNVDADRVIVKDIAKMRNRSRHAEQDETYYQRFLIEMETNIVGAEGIQFVSKARLKRGNDLNTGACEKITKAWADFSKRGNFDVTRQFSRPEFERLAIRSIARDGQFLPRLVNGIDKLPHRFGVQGFEADALDHTFTEPENNIRLGIKRDEWGEPEIYHLLKRDDKSFGYSRNRDHEKVPAENMLHLFISERINQSVGVPWGNAALKRLHFLTKYEEAMLVNARLQANNHVYFEQDADSEGGYTGAKNDDGTIDAPSEPGQSQTLPAGVKAHVPMPSQPDPNYPDFRKGILRGACAGLITSYNVIGNDLEGVSFSSIRQGTLSDRAIWEVIQSWFIAEFEVELFRAWLPMAILSGELDLPIADLSYLGECEFNGRRWPWVDPLKDIKAAGEEIKLHLNSEQGFCRERGKSHVTVVKEQAEDKARVDDAGLAPEPEPPANPPE